MDNINIIKSNKMSDVKFVSGGTTDFENQLKDEHWHHWFTSPIDFIRSMQTIKKEYHRYQLEVIEIGFHPVLDKCCEIFDDYTYVSSMFRGEDEIKWILYQRKMLDQSFFLEKFVFDDRKLKFINNRMLPKMVDVIIVDNQHRIDADVVVSCVGFYRNAATVKDICDYKKMYNNNYMDKDLMYLADAHIDDDAFNSLFGSSVLEMVKFYMDVYVYFFNNNDYYAMIESDGIETISIEDRKWSDYIAAAATLVKHYPDIYDAAGKRVSERTRNFIEAHDLETYIAANKREWIDTHTLLAGKPMQAEACLPYVFQKLIDRKIDI